MTDGFTLPPLTEALVDADAFSDWMLAADRGCPPLVIAEGRVRPVHAPVWFAAILAEKAGKARIVAARADAPGCWRWSVEWLAARDGAVAERASLRAARGGRRTGEPTTADGEPVTDAMMRLIRRHANAGKGAPSLRELARIAELPLPQSAQHWVAQLVKRGAIKIERCTDTIHGERRRFALIDAHGKVTGRTGWSAGNLNGGKG